jgi:hypothetical protein
VFSLSVRNSEKRRQDRKEKTWLWQPIFSSVWHTGQCPVRQAGPREKAALGTRRRRTAIIHRTVRWCTGLSGESSATNSAPSGKAKGRRGYNSPDYPVVHRTVRWANGRLRQRSAAQSSRDTWTAPTVSWCTGLRQSARWSNGRICHFWKEVAHRTVYRTCPVAHWTVRCATRQKARMAFQVCLQRLLAALGL